MGADDGPNSGCYEMKWSKLGKVYNCENWAQCPTPLVMEDRIRVYFSSRDERGKSYIRFVDLALDDPSKIIDICFENTAVLENGKPGTFDDEGQIPSFARRVDGKIELWYSGWNSRNTIPYHNATGVAVSDNGGRTFKRIHDGPVMDRTPQEPYLAVTPSFDGQNIYYISGLEWRLINERYEPIYAIRRAWLDYGDKCAVSRRGTELVIPQSKPLECFSRPWVLKVKDNCGKDFWHLWYSYRVAVDYRDGKNAYRIGYADSWDGEEFFRRDSDAGIDRGALGEWDHTMTAYPAVVKVKGRLLMFFNGNSFGRYGFGVAVAE